MEEPPAPSPARRPLVIGHRGFAARYPENTAAGVRAALAAGADGVEVDARLSADGLWVCHHDLRFRGEAVHRHPWRDLRANGVDPLEEILAAVPGERWLYLEIKPLAARHLEAGLEALHGILAPHGPTLRILSSSRAVLEAVAPVLPGAIPSLVIRRAHHPPLPARWTLSPHHTLVERLLPSGRELHPWTVNHPRRQRQLAALGIPSLTTDDPARALAALER